MSEVGSVLEHRAPDGWKVLVTGAAGFIGSHVARDCANLGLEVVAVDDLSGGFRQNLPSNVRFVLGDVKNATFVSELMAIEQFDVVYHLAAYAAEGLSHFIRNYNYNNNLIATTNIITQSVRIGSVKKFVFTSSIAVYGSGRTPMTEDMEPLPEDPYGISKLACEYDLRAAHEMFGLDYVIFRPHNVYGPGQNMYDKYRNVVGIFLNQLQSGKKLTVFGDGEQTRKFSYISDVSLPIALSGILPHVRNEVFNVGGDIATTVNELAVVTSTAWDGSAAEVEHLDSRNEVAHAESDHQKLNCFFPGLPKPVGLRDGMREMVQWAKSTGKYFKPVEFDAVEIKKNLPPTWSSASLQEVPAFHHDLSDNTIELARQSVASDPLLVSRHLTTSTHKDNNRVSESLFQTKDGFKWRQPKANGGVQSTTLLTITTSHSAWNMVRLMLVSLAAVEDDFDVLLIDDHSAEYDQNTKAEEWGVQTLRWGNPGDPPRGNTHMWNLAWKYAKTKRYDNLIICNNDLLIPNGTISKLVDALTHGRWDWVNPTVSRRGSGYPMHTLNKIYGKNVQEWTDHPLHYANVARAFGGSNNLEDVHRVSPMNGYTMAFRVDRMQRFEYSDDILFNPENINIGNEDELCARMREGGNTGVHTTAFVYHFKGFTLKSGAEGRQTTKGFPVLDNAF